MEVVHQTLNGMEQHVLLIPMYNALRIIHSMEQFAFLLLHPHVLQATKTSMDNVLWKVLRLVLTAEYGMDQCVYLNNKGYAFMDRLGMGALVLLQPKEYALLIINLLEILVLDKLVLIAL